MSHLFIVLLLSVHEDGVVVSLLFPSVTVLRNVQ